jgi:hypothetical protein
MDASYTICCRSDLWLSANVVVKPCKLAQRYETGAVIP